MRHRGHLKFWALAMTDPHKPGFFDIVLMHELTEEQLNEARQAVREERSRRQCHVVWVPGVLYDPHSKMPRERTRCSFADGHAGDHSWGPEFNPDDHPYSDDEDPDLQGAG